MILEIKRLFAKGDYLGGFTFDYQPDKDKLLIPLCAFDGDIKVEGNYEIFDDYSVDISFRISYRIKGQCSYCLEDAEKEIEFSSDVTFVTDKSDGDNYVYDGNRLNLAAAVDDALLFSQPKVLLCKEDCKGIKIN